MKLQAYLMFFATGQSAIRFIHLELDTYIMSTQLDIHTDTYNADEE